MVNSLKSFNVFGTITIRPGRAVALAVSVKPNAKSLEKSASCDLPPVAGLSGTHQVLFGARIEPHVSPDIAVFQVEERPGVDLDLVNLPEVQDLIKAVLKKMQDSLTFLN